MRLFFLFDSNWAFHPIADVLRPQRDGVVGRVRLGTSPITLREVPSSKIRFSTHAVRITADLPKSDKTEIAPK